jgi:hypothetical protein
MELAQNSTCLIMSVLLYKPTWTFLEEPSTTGDNEARNDLKCEGKTPWVLINFGRDFSVCVELTLEVTVHLEAPITEPLRNEEAPRQHPLKQATELPTILRSCNFGLRFESANSMEIEERN